MMDLLASKLLSLFIILILTIICGLFPIKVSQLCSGKKGQLVISLLHCFAGGVFLGTFLVHLFPEVQETVMETMASAAEAYPISESLVAAGFFLILTMEQVIMIINKMRDDNLAEALKEPSMMKQSEDEKQREETSALTEDTSKKMDLLDASKTAYGTMQEQEEDLSEGSQNIKKTRAAVLVFAISLHSIFEGMALGLQKRPMLVWSLMAALSTHKMIMAFTIGLQLVQAFKPAIKPVVICMLVFSTVSPIGIALGTLISEAPHSNSVLARVSVSLEGIAAGSFLYVSFFEILVPEIKGKKPSLIKVLCIFVGYMCMAGLRFLHPE